MATRRERTRVKAVHPPRVVLIYTTGSRAGLRQILGCVDQLRAEFNVQHLPPKIDGVNFGDHAASCMLTATKRRYVVYTEIENVQPSA